MQDFLPFFALARLPLLLQRLDARLTSLEQCLPSAPAEPGMRVEREAWCERGFKQTKCHSRERERNRSATTDRPRERDSLFSSFKHHHGMSHVFPAFALSLSMLRCMTRSQAHREKERERESHIHRGNPAACSRSRLQAHSPAGA